MTADVYKYKLYSFSVCFKYFFIYEDNNNQYQTESAELLILDILYCKLYCLVVCVFAYQSYRTVQLHAGISVILVSSCSSSFQIRTTPLSNEEKTF